MPTRRLLLSALLATAMTALSVTAPPALAFDRPFPTFAKRGIMKPDLFPSVVIDGKPRILTAGARIWNTDNLIQMPASLPVRNVVVNYTEDDSAYIDRIWILTTEEAAQTPKQQNINQPRQ